MDYQANKKKLQPLPGVIDCSTKSCVDLVAEHSSEIIASHLFITLEMANDRLYRSSMFHLFPQTPSQTTPPLSINVDFSISLITMPFISSIHKSLFYFPSYELFPTILCLGSV